MLPLRIAFRYLFSKKSTNAINIISWVSMAGMAVGAFALIVVLSVFNGFEGLVLSLYNSFYPDIEIRAAVGKTFEDSPEMLAKIVRFDEVAKASRTLEENAYLEYGNEAQIGTIKGVDEQYNAVNTVSDYVRIGGFDLGDSTLSKAVVGGNIAISMNITTDASFETLRITVPRKGVKSTINPADAFNTLQLIPAGIFSIQQEFDSKYVFVSLNFAKELLGGENRISAYELKLKPGADLENTSKKLKEALGKNFEVRTRYQQKAEMYRVMVIERWVTTAILAFIILIISFNIIGSLSMLVLEKSRDISILKAMGADAGLIRRVYLLNGMLASLIGAGIGLLLGYTICFLQLKFHFLKLSGGGGSSFVIDYYPVKLKLIDPLVAVGIIVTISLLAAYFPSRKAAQNEMSFK
ncbi:MAG: FtsX-like permease family protein [Chitinophagales bacterium]